MLAGRCGLAAAALNGSLFVCGSYSRLDDPPDLDLARSAERYLPGSDAWESLPPMALPREGHALVACGGRLLAAGGIDFGTGTTLRS
eukprot:15466870-Alexandrium_andersonii.AAC.1